MTIKGKSMKSLLDTGSSHNFGHPRICHLFGITPQTVTTESVTFASETHTKPVSEYVELDLYVNDRLYEKVKIKIMDNLCADLILGNVFQREHESVIFKFGGPLPPLEVCGLSTLNVDPPAPFQNLTNDCRPIATKSHRYTKPDQLFIKSELQNFLREGIVEPSESLWRAQLLIVREEENHKRRL